VIWIHRWLRPSARPPRPGGGYSQLQLLLRTSGGALAPPGFCGGPHRRDPPNSLPTPLPLAALPTVTAANPQAEALRTSLNGRGQRLTPQRQRVLGLFERIGEGSHLSAEEVHQRLLKGDEKVSLATVYRTLRLLSSMQLLQELELPDGGRRFELAGDTNRDHHHLVCVRCGQTEEFESHDVLKAGERAAGLHGFRLLECVLNVRAVCPSCAQAEGA
jgi:Fur family ferric uptake transcriptional regulator